MNAKDFDKTLARQKYLTENPDEDNENIPSREALIAERQKNARRMGMNLNEYLSKV